MPDRLLVAAVIVGLVAAGAFAYDSYPQPQELSSGGTSGAIVPPDQIVSGGPPPDGIPSIDNPKFVSAANATWLSDDYDWVIGISYHGDIKAYPLQILVWHEIVNDMIGSVPVSVTYCPLCFATAAYVRVINGTTVQFGTSGKLYNNNLVMYDRLTKSLWSQIWGKAIAGSLAGHALQRIPTDVMTWGEWKKLNPQTLVLSRQTGFFRDYGDDPYGGSYYETSQIWFPLSHLDMRLPPKTILLGVALGGTARAYALGNLTSQVWMDSVGGQDVLVWVDGSYAVPTACTSGPCNSGQHFQVVRFFNPIVNGKLLTFGLSNGTIMDLETHSVWNFDGLAIKGPLAGMSMARFASETAFWFAWAAFYPGSTIYPS
jgi:hypothetical protein